MQEPEKSYNFLLSLERYLMKMAKLLKHEKAGLEHEF